MLSSNQAVSDRFISTVDKADSHCWSREGMQFPSPTKYVHSVSYLKMGLNFTFTNITFYVNKQETPVSVCVCVETMQMKYYLLRFTLSFSCIRLYKSQSRKLTSQCLFCVEVNFGHDISTL